MHDSVRQRQPPSLPEPTGPPHRWTVAARYSAPYRPRRRRTRTLTHPLRMIPHVAGAAAIATVAVPAVALGWASVLTTGRMPRTVVELLAGAQRHYARLNGSLYLLTDAAPGWVARPGTVELLIDAPTVPHGPGRDEARRRAAEIPSVVLRSSALGLLVLPTAVVAWVAVLATGTMPVRAHRLIALGTSYHARGTAYLSLLTDVVPEVRERDATTGAPVTPGSGGV